MTDRCTGLKPTRRSTAVRRFDRSDVDLFHLHHRIERALGGGIPMRSSVTSPACASSHNIT
jgi:hypothetical protein